MKNRSNLGWKWLTPAVAALGLLAVSCGGADDLDAPAGALDTGDGQVVAEQEPTDGPTEQDFTGTLAMNTAALDASSLSPEMVVVAEGSRGTERNVTPVIDTCSALDGAELDAITARVDADEGAFAAPTSFDDGTAQGASCIYRSDTHAIEVVVGSAGEVFDSPDSPAAMVPIMGRVDRYPWRGGEQVTLFGEDSFELLTYFAAHAPAGDLGVVVNNVGGTGIDASVEGDFFARVALAAAAGAPGADAVGTAPDDAQVVSTTAQPCDWFTQDELAAFLGIFVGAADPMSSEGVETCIWSADSPSTRYVRIDVRPTSAAYFNPDFWAETQQAGIWTQPKSLPANAALLTADTYIEIAVGVYGDAGDVSEAGGAAALALVQNLADRLAAG